MATITPSAVTRGGWRAAFFGLDRYATGVIVEMKLARFYNYRQLIQDI